MKRLFKFRYPKIAILIFSIFLAYLIFRIPGISEWINGWTIHYHYLSYFAAGMLITLGFTAPFAVGFLILTNPNNIWIAALIAAAGASFCDIIIFKLIRISFMDEFKRIENTKTMKEIGKLIDYEFGHKVKIYLLYIFIGLVIASPLPDEIGVVMLAGLTRVRTFFLAKLSFILHFIGILVLLKI